jgi:hypothetical protein
VRLWETGGPGCALHAHTGPPHAACASPCPCYYKGACSSSLRQMCRTQWLGLLIPSSRHAQAAATCRTGTLHWLPGQPVPVMPCCLVAMQAV